MIQIVGAPYSQVTVLVTVIGNMVKAQTGARVDALVLEKFRSLCRVEGLSIGQCIDRFMGACVEAHEISGVLGLLTQTNQGQFIANELTLKRLMVDLEVSIVNEDIEEVWNGMERVEKMIPRIQDLTLQRGAKELLESAISFYRKAAVRT